MIYRRPDDVVRRIIKGDTKNLPFDEDNEVTKGYHFEDQARVNARLEKHYTPICSVLEKECMKEKCRIYKKGQMGQFERGWVCKEYCVDFPKASFDSRYHVYLIGEDKIDFNASIEKAKEMKKQGAKYACLNCKKLYEQKRTEPYEDGHGGRMLEMCPCGSDLFSTIDELIADMQGIVNKEKKGSKKSKA